MPVRALIDLSTFTYMCRDETRSLHTWAGQMAAMRHHAEMTSFDVEWMSVTLGMPDGTERHCVSPRRDQPFRLRVGETPSEEFRKWLPEAGGGFILEPRWFVRVIQDPAGCAAGSQLKGVRAWIVPRIYLAHEEYTPEFRK